MVEVVVVVGSGSGSSGSSISSSSSSSNIPIIIGANAPFQKSLRQNLSNVPGKHEIKEKKNGDIGHYTPTAGKY